MKLILLALMTAATFFMMKTEASTFVGNGGNTGDVELQVTLLQLTNTLDSIIASEPSAPGDLCKCQRLMGAHKMCDALETLKPRQAYFCSDTLRDKAAELRHLIQNKNGVQVVWTKEEIDVYESTGERRADAVAQTGSNNAKTGLKNSNGATIYLNQKQFLAMQDYERIFLLTHELGHLVRIDDHFVRDEESVGPFQQKDGGRQLLNAMAAATSMKAIDNDQINNYTATLARSQNYMDDWLTLNFASENNRDDKSTFAITKYHGWSASYRHQWGQHLGTTLEFRNQTGDENFFKMTKAAANFNYVNAQINYRLFPFNDPLTISGQSHFILGAGYEIGTAELQVNDDFDSISEKTNLAAPLATVSYFFPLKRGVWIEAGLHYALHKYEFEEIGYTSSNGQLSSHLGVSYGF